MFKSFPYPKISTLCAFLAGVCACDEPDGNDPTHEPAALDADSLAAAIDAAIVESMDYEPPASVFEYTGDIRDPDAPWRRGARTDRVKRSLSQPGDDDGGSDLVDILTRDGRTYRQRNGTQTHHAGHISRLDPGLPGDAGIGDDVDDSAELKARELITDGVDNRQRVTTSSAHGVAVKLAAYSTSPGPTCSASMIAPRVFLTAAHCLTDDNGDWSDTKLGASGWIMPAARGQTYSGSDTSLDADDAPFGARQVIRFAKPSGWTGTGTKYDYAIMVIGDDAPDNSGAVKWAPTPVQFASESCGTLDGANVNLRGYPGRKKTCADASSEDNGLCGGFAYSEAGPIDQCTDESVFYYHDSQEGQSGAPVYRYSANSGVRIVVGVNTGTYDTRNWGHKIRTGSYGAICDHVTDPENLSSYFSNPSC